MLSPSQVSTLHVINPLKKKRETNLNKFEPWKNLKNKVAKERKKYIIEGRKYGREKKGEGGEINEEKKKGKKKRGKTKLVHA